MPLCRGPRLPTLPSYPAATLPHRAMRTRTSPFPNSAVHSLWRSPTVLSRTPSAATQRPRSPIFSRHDWPLRTGTPIDCPPFCGPSPQYGTYGPAVPLANPTVSLVTIGLRTTAVTTLVHADSPSARGPPQGLAHRRQDTGLQGPPLPNVASVSLAPTGSFRFFSQMAPPPRCIRT